MRTPIIRLTIGQTCTINGDFIGQDETRQRITKSFNSEHDAKMHLFGMRESDNEFQLVTIRDCADFKRMAAMV
jgi:hypothetical protein